MVCIVCSIQERFPNILYIHRKELYYAFQVLSVSLYHILPFLYYVTILIFYSKQKSNINILQYAFTFCTNNINNIEVGQ